MLNSVMPCTETALFKLGLLAKSYITKVKYIYILSLILFSVTVKTVLFLPKDTSACSTISFYEMPTNPVLKDTLQIFQATGFNNLMYLFIKSIK